MSGSNYTLTTNYGFYKPIPNADTDTWGDHLNLDMDALDSLIHGIDTRPPGGVTSWNTRTGAVTLQATDVTALGFATTSANDARYYAATNPSGYVTASGAASAAPVQSVAGRGGAVSLTHSDITDWAASLASYAPLASPTFSGTVTLGGNATTSLGAVSLQQLNAAIGGVTGPGPATAVPLVDATPGLVGTSTLYARQDHVHPTDGSRAPLASPVFTGSPQLPAATAAVTAGVADNSTALATTAFVQTAVSSVAANATAAQNNIGRNYVHNGAFAVAQRGAGPFTTNGVYTADRWKTGVSLDTISFTTGQLNDADRAAIGDEAAYACLINVFTGNAGAAAFNLFSQIIEDVRRLANKTITVSFWAKAGSGAPKLGVSIDQVFGTGGSPSANVNLNGQAITLSTTFARYSATFTLPSIAGKVLGSNNDHCTYLNFWCSSGTSQAARAGSIGVQSGTFVFYGVQLELGSVVTPLQKREYADELRLCQRFYFSGNFQFSVYQGAGSGFGYMWGLPAPMRASPTVTPSYTVQTNCSSSGFTVFSTSEIYLHSTATAAGAVVLAGTYTASADL